MIYLVLGAKGFYISLSKNDAALKCKKIAAMPGKVLSCRDFRDAVRLIKYFQPEGMLPIDVPQIGRVTLWEPIEYRCLIDLESGTRWRFCNTGEVQMTCPNRKNVNYINCPNQACSSQKMVKLLEKYGELRFFDFSVYRYKKVLRDGSIWYLSEECGVWKKLS